MRYASLTASYAIASGFENRLRDLYENKLLRKLGCWFPVLLVPSLRLGALLETLAPVERLRNDALRFAFLLYPLGYTASYTIATK